MRTQKVFLLVKFATDTWDLPLDFSVKSEAKIEGELQEMIRQASNGISKEPT